MTSDEFLAAVLGPKQVSKLKVEIHSVFSAENFTQNFYKVEVFNFKVDENTDIKYCLLKKEKVKKQQPLKNNNIKRFGEKNLEIQNSKLVVDQLNTRFASQNESFFMCCER